MTKIVLYKRRNLRTAPVTLTATFVQISFQFGATLLFVPDFQEKFPF